MLRRLLTESWSWPRMKPRKWDEYVSGEHFLLALFTSQLKDSAAAKALTENGVTRAEIEAALKQIRGNTMNPGRRA